MNIYSGVDSLPKGRASDHITPGCLVLEGGAWRGIYTQGALDALMEGDINFQTTIGISAGAMSGLAYVSGQIGLSGRVNLTWRHDPNYCGMGAMIHDHGITGFSYFLHTILPKEGFDFARFYDPSRRFVAGATNCETGRCEYFEKGSCPDIFRAVAASATVPYISRPVMMDGKPYLDGGCSVKVPYRWAAARHFQKIMVIRTREKPFRKELKDRSRLNRLVFRQYPELQRSMNGASLRYNHLMDQIEEDEAAGKIFVLTPKDPVTISRFEGNMEKLGELYWRGYHEMKDRMSDLEGYLKA